LTPIAISTCVSGWTLLEEQLATVNRMAAANELPDAIITTGSGLKITPLDAAVPDAAQALIDQTRHDAAARQDYRAADGGR
jgi:hypothetical protein